MRTLIVDDTLDNRRLLWDILKPFGPCDMASNGIDALNLIEVAMDEGEPYDLVLLDIMMPKMDGQEALQRIRALEQQRGRVGPKEAVIFMVTANDSPREAAAAFFKGYCSDYLTKPILRRTLLDKLQEYQLITP
ncbi:MAG: response regulator [Magnetococcales bacterium]|nr:response regulator [Magnetococcales bacterium]